MNTEKVFRAFNKEGEEIVLYRENKDIYIDLNSDTNSIYPKEDIDLDTLLLLSKTIDLWRHMTTSSIQKKYKKDREKLVETKKVLIGLKVKISKLQSEKIDSGVRYYGIPVFQETQYKWEGIPQHYSLYMPDKPLIIKNRYDRYDDKYKFNILKDLSEFDNYVAFYENERENIHKIPNFKNGMEYVVFNNSTLEDLIKETYVEKKLVYEYANQARKEIVEEKK